MSEGSEVLFSSHDLGRAMEAEERRMREEIDGMEGNRLLNTSADDLCDYFEGKYRLEAPRLREEQIVVDQRELDVDVRQHPGCHVRDAGQPFNVKGTMVTLHVPFEGDARLLTCRPSSFTPNPPRGHIRGSEIVLEYVQSKHDAAKLKSEADRQLGEIRRWLGWIEEDLKPFNGGLRARARRQIEARREKLLKDQGLAASLGYPLRRREDAPQTYAAPVARRKIPKAMPPASTEPFEPEPTLPMEEYENILRIIENMTTVMERSPTAFSGMKEEDLRQHFLVQLNAQYEGQATGETFNSEGRTDILIRVENKNIFIAECKFWRRPESLTEALDQLLGYSTWRDTKTAVLVFNRMGKFSRVLEQIPEQVKGHPNFKREVEIEGDTRFRFVLGRRDDPSRELIVTVLAFEVPK